MYAQGRVWAGWRASVPSLGMPISQHLSVFTGSKVLQTLSHHLEYFIGVFPYEKVVEETVTQETGEITVVCLVSSLNSNWTEI